MMADWVMKRRRVPSAATTIKRCADSRTINSIASNKLVPVAMVRAGLLLEKSKEEKMSQHENQTFKAT
jgi:hypothetical protein